MNSLINTICKRIFLFTSLLFPIALSAKEVPLKVASQVAINVFSEKSGLAQKSIEIKNVIPVESDGIVLYRIFNFNPTGYIIVTADDNAEPLIGYGLSSNFSFDDATPALSYLLGEYKQEMEYIIKNELKADNNITSKWQRFSSEDYVSLKSYTAGTYLLGTNWNQTSPYNNSCPLDPITGRRCPVGCTAVAMGQILKYWGCRVFPDGTSTYYPNSNFTNPLTVNFHSQSYNWSNIGSNVTATADFLYHCGVAIQVNYTENETGAPSFKVENALENYYGFQTSGLKWKSSYSESTWINMLKADIDAGRPIYYGGTNTTVTPNVGHAWVIDGYKTTNEFHCNWGKGGTDNEWYYLSDLTPGSDNYNSNPHQHAILNAEPILDACSGLSGATTICYPDTVQYSVSIPSIAGVTWNVTGNLSVVGSNTNPTCNVRSTSNSGESGTITATIKNSQNQTFLTRTKTVWAGKPNTPTQIIPFWNNGMEFGNDSYYDFQVNPQQGATSYTWVVGGGVITDGQGTNWITVKTNKITGSNNINFNVSVRAEGCVASSYFVRTGWVVPGTGGSTLLFTPNPAIGETTMTIETTSPEVSVDQAVEWEMEVYSPAQNLKEKQTKLKGNSTKIQTTGWQEGVYVVRVKYKDEILTGKLVVKK